MTINKVENLKDVAEDTGEVDDKSQLENDIDEEYEGNIEESDILKKLFGGEDSEDSEDKEADEEKEEEEEEETSKDKTEKGPGEEEAIVDDNEKPKFSQKDLDRIISSRLSRVKGLELESLAPHIKELKEITGMNLPDIVEYIRKSRVTQVADEKGWSEQEAKEYLDNERRAKEAEEQRRVLEEQNKLIQYTNQKILYLNNPKISADMKAFAMEFDQEIDTFSHGGRIVDYDVAVKYILGEKMQAGDIQKRIRQGAEQKTLANISKRSKAAPMTGSQGGKRAEVSLTREEKLVAKQFGLSAAEVLEEKTKIEKEKQRSR